MEFSGISFVTTEPAAITDPGSDKVAAAIGMTGEETNRILRKISGNTA